MGSSRNEGSSSSGGRDGGSAPGEAGESAGPRPEQESSAAEPRDTERAVPVARPTAELSQAMLLDVIESEEEDGDDLDRESEEEDGDDLDRESEEEDGDDLDRESEEEDGGDLDRESEERGQSQPPPPPAEARGHRGPPPIGDASNEMLAGPQWLAVRRSARRRIRTDMSLEAIDKAIRVVDVDLRPLEQRQQAEQADPWGYPWGTITPSAAVEGRIALEVMRQMRRPTLDAVEVAPSRFRSLWWMGAAASLTLAVFSVVVLVKTRMAATAAVATGAGPAAAGSAALPGPPSTSSAALPAAAPDSPGARSTPGPASATDVQDLHDGLLVAFRAGDYAEVIRIGARLEAEQSLDREARFTVAEAVRLSRLYDEALRRYAEFIRRFPRSTLADDAHFWMAEIMRMQGNFKGARLHYRAVVKNTRSNVRSLAKKRLSQLD